MILFGATRQQFVSLSGGTPFLYYGALNSQLSPQANTGVQFPVYGAVQNHMIAPVKFLAYGATLTQRTAATKVKAYGAKVSYLSKGANLTGLAISAVTQCLHFETPKYVYNIYPYLISDVYKVIGGTDYLIIGNELIFEVLPLGPIEVVPFSRLQINADEVIKLTVTNMIPTRADFLNIAVSSTELLFSLAATGPWTSTLNIIDIFYIKGPSRLTDGVDFKDITVTATVLPRG